MAYTRPECHRGEGKEIWSRFNHALQTESKMGQDDWNDLVAKRYEIYSSALVRGPNFNWGLNNSKSLRLLQVGTKRFWVEYTSNESWMSNVGDGNCEVVDYEDCASPHPVLFRYPLYAVDFVIGRAGKYAVDLNISPQIRGTGVEKYMKAEEVVNELEKWIC